MKKVVLFLTLSICGVVFYQNEIKNFFYKQNHSGLINFDYGIISIDDLNKSDKDSFPALPFDGTHIGYPYWQCFNKKYLKMECSYNEPLDQQGSSLGIDIETDSEIHSYGLNHAVSGEICDELITEIKNVIKNRTHFCINGSHGTLDRVGAKKEYSWSYYRLKTSDGYAHYFNED